MKKNTFQELTNEQLIKKRDLLKGVTIGFGVIYLLSIAIFIYIFTTKGANGFSIATMIPILALPVTLSPLLINLSLVNKEIVARKL